MGIAPHGRGSVGVGQRLQGAAHGLEARRVGVDRLAALAAQPREHAVAAEEARLVRRGQTVVGNARRRRLRVLLPLQRELAASEGRQVRPRSAAGQDRPVARREDDAPRISGGHERAAPRGRARGGSESAASACLARPSPPPAPTSTRRRWGLEDPVARGAPTEAESPRAPRGECVRGHLGDLRLGRGEGGGSVQHPERLARLPRLLGRPASVIPAQPEREGAVHTKADRAATIASGSVPTARRGGRAGGGGRLSPIGAADSREAAPPLARIVATPRVVGGRFRRDAGVPAGRCALAPTPSGRSPPRRACRPRADPRPARTRRRSRGDRDVGAGPAGRCEKEKGGGVPIGDSPIGD